MASVSHKEFDANTEGVEVAKAFADGIRGKTVLVTGGNRHGLGFSAAHALVSTITLLKRYRHPTDGFQASQSPAQIILTGRSVPRIQECVDALKEEFPNVVYKILQVDLSAQDSVRAAAAEVLAWDDVPSINLIINSAGVMGVQERTITKDGIELTFATNHIGHWLLSCLLMPKLIKAAENSPKGATRIVNISSGSPYRATMRWSDINFNKLNKDLPQDEQPHYQVLEGWGYKDAQEVAYIPLDSYNRSKVANVLFGIGANKRLFEKHGILTLAVHPGVIQTDLARNFPKETLDALDTMRQNKVYTYKSFGAGSSTALVAALDPGLANGVGESHEGAENWGAFLDDCQITGKAMPLAVSSSEAEKLWELSEQLVGQNFGW